MWKSLWKGCMTMKQFRLNVRQSNSSVPSGQWYSVQSQRWDNGIHVPSPHVNSSLLHLSPGASVVVVRSAAEHTTDNTIRQYISFFLVWIHDKNNSYTDSVSSSKHIRLPHHNLLIHTVLLRNLTSHKSKALSTAATMSKQNCRIMQVE